VILGKKILRKVCRSKNKKGFVLVGRDFFPFNAEVLRVFWGFIL